MKNHKQYKQNILRARLSFDEGFAENPIYSIKASTTEKPKGFDMIELIMTNFNVTLDECRRYIEEKQKMFAKEMRALSKTSPTVNWSRDKLGNIISPFRTNKKW